MADEIQENEAVVVTQTVETTEATAAAAEPVVDWNAAPPVEETVVEQTTVVTTTSAVESEAPTYYAPRGRWDFTDSQRIILGILIWLNIIIITLGYLALTGQLTI